MKSSLPLIAAFGLLAACSQPAEDNGVAPMLENEAASNTAAETPARQKSAEETFADAVAAANSYEIAASTIAEKKGNSAAVRAFGKKAAFDHNQATMKLKMAAADVDGGLFIDPTLSAEQENNVVTLQKLSGPEFDSTFINQQIVAHARLIKILDDYRQGNGPQPLTTFAARGLPMLREHAAKLKAL